MRAERGLGQVSGGARLGNEFGHVAQRMRRYEHDGQVGVLNGEMTRKGDAVFLSEFDVYERDVRVRVGGHPQRLRS